MTFKYPIVLLKLSIFLQIILQSSHTNDLLKELDPHVLQMPRSLLGHLSQAKLQQLSHLLEELLEGMGSFP